MAQKLSPLRILETFWLSSNLRLSIKKLVANHLKSYLKKQSWSSKQLNFYCNEKINMTEVAECNPTTRDPFQLELLEAVKRHRSRSGKFFLLISPSHVYVSVYLLRVCHKVVIKELLSTRNKIQTRFKGNINPLEWRHFWSQWCYYLLLPSLNAIYRTSLLKIKTKNHTIKQDKLKFMTPIPMTSYQINFSPWFSLY